MQHHTKAISGSPVFRIAAADIGKLRTAIRGYAFRSLVAGEEMHGGVLNISAEFEDCKKAAGLSGVPVKDVIRKAEEEARKWFC